MLGGGTVTHQAKLCSFEAQIIWEDVPNNLISEVDSEAHPLFLCILSQDTLLILLPRLQEKRGISQGTP